MPKTTKPVKTWLDAFNEYDNPHQISKTDFRKILYAFNTLLYQSIIYEGKSYKLPHGIGTFSVLKGKTAKRGYFDYDSYNKHGIKRFIRNHHSAGMVAKVKWVTNGAFSGLPPLSRELFSFKPARHVSRLLAKAIKEHNTINLYYDY